MSRKSSDRCNKVSRRDFLSAGLAVPALGIMMPDGLPGAVASAEAASSATPTQRSSILQVDFDRLVSRADLTYTTPVDRSDAGMPVGNGQMGSLVWTTPSSLKFQINRPDVFAEGRNTNSFPERHTDYGSGCGYLDINVADFADDVFAPPAFRQHLGVYDALMTATGKSVTARVLAWHEHDVMAVEIDDQRAGPEPVSVDLRMLRYIEEYFEGENCDLTRNHTVMVRHRDQTAASTLEIRGGRIILKQKFQEGDFYSSSALAVAVAGRNSKAKYANNSTVRLAAAPGRGRFMILAASAASFDPSQDPAALVLRELDAAESKSFHELLESNRTWWHNFWSKAFVRLHSADGVADFVERNYTYFLYVMASSSRGAYPPRYGGMLWFTNGDLREWGSQHWWHNAGCYYDGLCPADRFGLMDPMFDMYTKMQDSCAQAARQQWGSKGIFIPETTWFDGLEELPAEIAEEMQALYLMRKPWDQRSAAFKEFAEPKLPHNSRWNWKGVGKWVNGTWIWKDKGAGPYGQTSHIFSSGAKIAFLYWLRYEYTQDLHWLRERAYPMLKDIAEFYRNYPNVRKGADGKYHIHHVNNHEPIWGAQDTTEELSAMRGIFPVVIRASEILSIDAEMRPTRREFVENLAPLPTNETPNTLDPRRPGEPLRWTAGLKPFLGGNPRRLSDRILIPALHYDLCTVETQDDDLVKTANTTFEALFPQGVSESTPVTVLSSVAIAAAYLGRANDVKLLLPNQIRSLRPSHDFCDWTGLGKIGVMRNRMTLREGPGDVCAERLGRACQALHTPLMQSVPAAPAQDPIIHVFPAWPKEWEAQYTLLARGAFLVTSSLRGGEVEFVEVHSNAGGQCRLRNPWGKSKVAFYRNGKKSEESGEGLLIFPTTRDENIVVVRAGSTPEQFKGSV